MPQTFNDADRLAICNALNLDRQQRTKQSRLQALLRNTEVFDQQYGTQVVREIKDLLEQIELTATALYGDPEEENPIDLGATADDGVRVVRIDREVTVERDQNAGPQAEPIANRLELFKSRLRTLIDPDRVLYGSTDGGLLLF